jgi:hypothetical protein
MKSIIKSILVLSLLGGLVACTPKPVEEDPFEPLTTFVASAILGNDVTKSISLALDEAEVSTLLKSAQWDRDDSILTQVSTTVLTITDKLGDRYAFSSGQQTDTVVVTRKSDSKLFGFKLTSGTVEDLRVLIQSIGSDPVLVKPQYSYMISFDGIYDPTKFIELDQSYNSVINLFPASILIETDNTFDSTGPIDYVLRVNLGKYITVYREGVQSENYPYELGWRYVSIGPYALYGPDCKLYLVSESDLGINSSLFYFPSVDGPETLTLSELNLDNYTIEHIVGGIMVTRQASFGLVTANVLDMLIRRLGDTWTITEHPHVADYKRYFTFETDLGFLSINDWGLILDEDPLTPGVTYYEKPQRLSIFNLLLDLEYFAQIPTDDEMPILTIREILPYTPGDSRVLSAEDSATLSAALNQSNWKKSNIIPYEPLTYNPEVDFFASDGTYVYFTFDRYENQDPIIVQAGSRFYYMTRADFLAFKAVLDSILVP